MGESSFARHGIEVIKDHRGELGLLTGRHKLLQIMINLISKVRHALVQHRGAPRQRIVRERSSDAVLVITGSLRGTGGGPGNAATVTLELPRTGEDQRAVRD